MKTLMIAVALIVASAAPVLAQDFAQSYELDPLTANRIPKGDTTMKTLMIAVALIVAFAAPVLAQDFAQSYSQNR